MGLPDALGSLRVTPSPGILFMALPTRTCCTRVHPLTATRLLAALVVAPVATDETLSARKKEREAAYGVLGYGVSDDISPHQALLYGRALELVVSYQLALRRYPNRQDMILIPPMQPQSRHNRERHLSPLPHRLPF